MMRRSVWVVLRRISRLPVLKSIISVEGKRLKVVLEAVGMAKSNYDGKAISRAASELGGTLEKSKRQPPEKNAPNGV